MYMAMGSVPATVQHLQPELATGLPSLQAVLGRVRRDLASPDCLVKNALKAAHNSRTPSEHQQSVACVSHSLVRAYMIELRGGDNCWSRFIHALWRAWESDQLEDMQIALDYLSASGAATAELPAMITRMATLCELSDARARGRPHMVVLEFLQVAAVMITVAYPVQSIACDMFPCTKDKSKLLWTGKQAQEGSDAVDKALKHLRGATPDMTFGFEVNQATESKLACYTHIHAVVQYTRMFFRSEATAQLDAQLYEMYRFFLSLVQHEVNRQLPAAQNLFKVLLFASLAVVVVLVYHLM